MDTFKSFLNSEPTLIELLEYKLEQYEQAVENVEKDLEKENSKISEDDFNLWNRGRLLGRKEELMSEIKSVKYQIRALKEAGVPE